MPIRATALTGASGMELVGVEGWWPAVWLTRGRGPYWWQGRWPEFGGQGSVVRTSSPLLWVGTGVVYHYRDVGAFWVLL